MRFRLLGELKEVMNPSKISVQPLLLSTEHSLEILQQNLSQLPAQPDELSETIKQLSLIKSELQSVLSTLSQPRDELISVLSHEFLTPLTLIIGPLQLLAAGTFSSGSQPAQFLLNVAFKQTNKLIRIVRELQSYQQMKSGQLKIVPQQCFAAELVKQAAQVIQLKGKQVGVILSVKPVFVSVWADPHLTILLVSHLLDNAIKFSPTRSIVTLTATVSKSGESQQQKHDFYGQNSLKSDYFSSPVRMGFPKSSFHIPEAQSVLFQVKDRGIGIPPDQLEKIFDCFYQVDRSDSRPYNGLGLGLALCRSIVHLHGGRLWVERNLGGGSIFYFTLPVYRPARHWWVEIQTKNPQCIYYFGPFENALEARDLQEGYLEDLMQEQARGITVEIKQCQPEHLTICGSAEMESEPEQSSSRKD